MSKMADDDGLAVQAISVWQWWEKQGEEEMKCVNRWAAVPATHTVEVTGGWMGAALVLICDGQVREQVLSLFLNIAACSLKLQRPHDTIYASNQATAERPPPSTLRTAAAAGNGPSS